MSQYSGSNATTPDPQDSGPFEHLLNLTVQNIPDFESHTFLLQKQEKKLRFSCFPNVFTQGRDLRHDV